MSVCAAVRSKRFFTGTNRRELLRADAHACGSPRPPARAADSSRAPACLHLLGGAVKGGRVLADWPGLASANLHEGRDLRATLDLRAVFKSVLRDHLSVPEQALDGEVFSESGKARYAEGLIRA